MTAASEIVRVELGSRSYEIHIGTGSLPQLGTQLAMTGAAQHVVLITDEHVERPHAETVAASLADVDIETDLVVVPAGETSKSIDVAVDLWTKLVELETDRRTRLIAVGGGVIGDLAGFVAATFARGISLIQVPTTLLAQVDSSVGGKVGINLPLAKNIVGAFWQPEFVWIDTAVLATLPEREYRAGLAEVVKYGVIHDKSFFALLEESIDALNAHDDAVLRTIVSRCCQIKADVVAQDEKETSGLRATLNYGHTFAHAIEQVAGYGEILHGEAVAMGMICASRLAETMGRIDAAVTERQQRLLAALELPTEMPSLDAEELIAAMQRDKKVAAGRLRFILPVRLGHVELVEDVPPQYVEGVLG